MGDLSIAMLVHQRVNPTFGQLPQLRWLAAIQGSACSSQQLQSSLKSTAHALAPKDGGAGCIRGASQGLIRGLQPLQPSETPKHQGFVMFCMEYPDIHGISLVFLGDGISPILYPRYIHMMIPSQMGYKTLNVSAMQVSPLTTWLVQPRKVWVYLKRG